MDRASGTVVLTVTVPLTGQHLLRDRSVGSNQLTPLLCSNRHVGFHRHRSLRVPCAVRSLPPR